MEKFVINGGNKLYGEVDISGAKNSAVAILPATLLAQGVCRIENIPNISDVTVMLKIIKNMGAKVKLVNECTYEIHVRYSLSRFPTNLHVISVHPITS